MLIDPEAPPRRDVPAVDRWTRGALFFWNLRRSLEAYEAVLPPSFDLSNAKPCRAASPPAGPQAKESFCRPPQAAV